MKYSIVLLAITITTQITNLFGQYYGDPGWEFDTTKYDKRIVAMEEWAKAGVQGGIPYRIDTEVKEIVMPEPGNSDMTPTIQAAIDNALTAGGGVVLLQNGTYFINSKIELKSNVILRGESRSGTKLISTMRYNGGHEKYRTETILMNNVTNSGLEDFTLTFSVQKNGIEMHPLDYDWEFETYYGFDLRDQNFQNDRVYYDRDNFKYDTVTDLYVTFVRITGESSKNIWIDNCSFIESGSDHIFIEEGEHITIRNTLVKGAFQKGSWGNGYGINCYGRYVLMTGNTVEQVRHWAIQQGAEYCVVYNCYSETDMNFHQGDLGLNLIENSEINIPYNHSWPVFATGADYHGDPGDANMFYNNSCILKSDGPVYTDDKIYTFDANRDVVVSEFDTPEFGTLYALKRVDTVDNRPSVNIIIPANGDSLNIGDSLIIQANATDDNGISNVKLYLNDTLVRSDSIAPYEWGMLATTDSVLKNLTTGHYNLKVIAEDSTGKNGFDEADVVVGSPVIAVSGIIVYPETLLLETENTSQLDYVIHPSNATDKDVLWTSSNENVATVDSLGNVLGIAAGNAIISATTTDGTIAGSSKVKVEKAEVLLPIESDTSFFIGNSATSVRGKDGWLSNMIINETQVYTNKTSVSQRYTIGSFSFYAHRLGDPLTPFLVKVNWDNDFTVLAIGTTRTNEEYLLETNSFNFLEGQTDTFSLAPKETIAIGLVDAFPDGSGGGIGSVVPFQGSENPDEIWYTGGTDSIHSGKLIIGEAPIGGKDILTELKRSYAFNVSITLYTDMEPSLINLGSELPVFNIYPNPLNGDKLTISHSNASGQSSVTIYSPDGKPIYKNILQSNTLTLQTDLFPEPGIYFIQLTTNSGNITKRLAVL